VSLPASHDAVAAAAGTPRIHRLPQIRSLDIGASFDRPTAFDPTAFWTAQRQRFETKVFQGEAMLRATRLGVQQLGTLGSAVGLAEKQSAGAPGVDGRMPVVVPIESIAGA
jgi:hypothetical protein